MLKFRWTALLLIAAMISISFGLLKQFKKNFNVSVTSLTAQKEPGSELLPWRAIILKAQTPEERQHSLLYVRQPRPEEDASRAVEADDIAQYALAPILISKSPQKNSRYALLDFLSAVSMRQYVKDHGWHLLEEDGGKGLAKIEAA